MKLFSQSGTSSIRFSNPGAQLGEILNVWALVGEELSDLIEWKIGVIFAIADVRLQISLKNTLIAGIIPAINYEDSTATRLQKATEAKNNSARIGVEFFVNSTESIGLIELKNYADIVYSLPITEKLGSNRKLLGKNDTFSASIVNLGFGSLALGDYIDISVDYIYEFDGFKPNDNLLLRFE
jgi:hypothetical protein